MADTNNVTAAAAGTDATAAAPATAVSYAPYSIPEALASAPLIAAPPQTTTVTGVAPILEEYYATVATWAAGLSLQPIQAQEVIEIALEIFNAQNFTGAISKGEKEQNRVLAALLDRASYADDEDQQRNVRKLLISDGEMTGPIVTLVPLLILAKAIARIEELVPKASLWRMRVPYRHQLCLEHRSHTLLLECATAVDDLRAVPELNNNPAILCEIAHIQTHFHRFEDAGETLFNAVKVTGLKFEEVGFQGVRTRWQKEPYMQSILNADSREPETEPLPAGCASEPPVEIEGFKDGHDLFTRPRVDKDAEEAPVSALKQIDKALVMGLSHDINNTNPLHGLTKHRIQIYVERLLVDPGQTPWILQAMEYLVRARLEQRRNRVQQRAFLQLQELVDQYQRNEKNVPTLPRAHSSFFYWVMYPSIWDMKREFGDLCFEDNLYKTALEYFEQIHDFDAIIRCCQQLDRRKKAETLARELLAKDPNNPKLLVALGEATREDKYLWQAWEAGEHKMAAPMRSLAKMALERELYDKVVEYFDIAVAINPIYGGDWFSLGFASLKLNNLERAAEAFTRCCMMDPNDAFGWNNLGSVMLRQDRPRPAFNAISQALRNNRRSWRMWFNYFTIGVELLEVTEAANALSIVLEIAHREAGIESKGLHKFIDCSIAYIKGEIMSTGNPVPSDEETWIPHHRHDKQNGEEEAAPVVEEEEEFTELVPLANDVEMPETFFPEKEAQRKAAIEAHRVKAVERYIVRIRALFDQIVDLFVQKPEIWCAYARLIRYLDGPKASYEIRLKELRCRQQQDQWERQEDLFLLTAQALHDMAGDALDCIEEDVAPSKYTVECIDSALQVTLDHFEDHEQYRKLQVLRMKVNKAAAKASKKTPSA